MFARTDMCTVLAFSAIKKDTKVTPLPLAHYPSSSLCLAMDRKRVSSLSIRYLPTLTAIYRTCRLPTVPFLYSSTSSIQLCIKRVHFTSKHTLHAVEEEVRGEGEKQAGK